VPASKTDSSSPEGELAGFLSGELRPRPRRARPHRPEIRWKSEETTDHAGLEQALQRVIEAAGTAPEALPVARVKERPVRETKPAGEVAAPSGADVQTGARRARRAGVAAWVVSLGLHVVGAGGATWLVTRAPAPAEVEEPAPVAVVTLPETGGPLAEIELPTMVEVTALRTARPSTSDDQAIEARPTGGDPTPRPDLDRRGRGGSDEAPQALNLADHDDSITLSRDLQSRLDRSQVQRLKVGDERSSPDDRRATWKPMELTFLVSGQGMERRTAAESDPAPGARQAGAPSLAGAIAGAAPIAPGEGLAPRDPGGATAGSDRPSPGLGAQGSTGSEHRTSADIGFARPSVAEGRPAVPGPAGDKARDSADSEQEVSAAVQSLLHASTAGGKVGVGVGGERGEGHPGAGGVEGTGSKAKVAGQGASGPVDLDGSDPRLSDYRRQVVNKISPLWANAFPHWAALDGRGGRAIIGFTILADGTVSGAFVARTSGIPEFDENVRRAVLKGAPFGPLPAKLNARSMRWFLSFDATNPAVR
jgi:TonB family protein